MNRLKDIIANKRAEISQLREVDFRARAEVRSDFRDFASAVRRHGPLRIIAETKRASPSAGIIAVDYDPAEIATLYTNNGADALSVLTEERFFGGSLDHLAAVRKRSPLPILRKDFILAPVQIYESSAAGADAILLIVAALSPGELCALHDCAATNKLSVLVEVHDKDEVGIALDAGSKTISINNRDLTTFELNLNTTDSLLPYIPEGITVVSESGIRTKADIQRLSTSRIDSLLVGEALMRASAEQLRELLSAR